VSRDRSPTRLSHALYVTALARDRLAGNTDRAWCGSIIDEVEFFADTRAATIRNGVLLAVEQPAGAINRVTLSP
jgi:hypothetical protein